MRRLRLEELENRELLSVTTSDYEQICAGFNNFNLSEIQSDTNIIELVDTTADSLQRAIQQAEQRRATI